MRLLLDRLPWGIVIVLAVFLGLAPFIPQPHLIEKVLMLSKGELRQIVDIFDLLFHASPLVILFLKLYYRFS